MTDWEIVDSRVTAAFPVFSPSDVGARLTCNGSKHRVLTVANGGTTVTLGPWRWHHTLRAGAKRTILRAGRAVRRAWWAFTDLFDKED